MEYNAIAFCGFFIFIILIFALTFSGCLRGKRYIEGLEGEPNYKNCADCLGDVPWTVTPTNNHTNESNGDWLPCRCAIQTILSGRSGGLVGLGGICGYTLNKNNLYGTCDPNFKKGSYKYISRYKLPKKSCTRDTYKKCLTAYVNTIGNRNDMGDNYSSEYKDYLLNNIKNGNSQKKGFWNTLPDFPGNKSFV